MPPMNDTIDGTQEPVGSPYLPRMNFGDIEKVLQQKRQRRTFGPATRTAGSGLRGRSNTGVAITEKPAPQSVLEPKSTKIAKGRKKGRRPPKTTVVEDTELEEEVEEGKEKPKRRGRPPKAHNGKQDEKKDHLLISGSFRFDSFVLSAKTEGSQQRKKFRVLLTKQFELKGDRASFQYEEM